MAKGGSKGKGGGAGGRDYKRDSDGKFASIGSARALLMSTARRVGDGATRPSSVALVKARTGLRKALEEARDARRGDQEERRDAARKLDVTGRLVARAALRAGSGVGKKARASAERKTLDDKLSEAMERTSGARSLARQYTDAWRALPADARFGDRARRSKDMNRAKKVLARTEAYENRLMARARRLGVEV